MSLSLLPEYQMPNWEDPPKRVISLVPSITESLFALGFGGAVVGVTDFCSQPAADLGAIVRVGGPKSPNFEIISELKPDLVIAGQEETEKQAVDTLAAMGIPVWVVFPKSVDDGMLLLRHLLGLFHTDKVVAMVNGLQIGVDYARAAAESMPQTSYFCPTWTGVQEGVDWWMTFNRDTYISDVLTLFGGQNVFADRERQYPLEADLGLCEAEPPGDRDIRYPRVNAGEVIAAQPEMILLPDDPYKFTAEDRALLEYALADTPAVRNGKFIFIDGSLISWYGVRIAKAIRTLPEFFQ